MNEHDETAGLSPSELDESTVDVFLWHETLLSGFDSLTKAAPAPKPRPDAAEDGSA